MADIRRAGAEALDRAWLATGLIDPYCEYDVADGRVLCESTGLAITVLDHDPRLADGLLVCDDDIAKTLRALVTPSA